MIWIWVHRQNHRRYSNYNVEFVTVISIKMTHFICIQTIASYIDVRNPSFAPETFSSIHTSLNRPLLFQHLMNPDDDPDTQVTIKMVDTCEQRFGNQLIQLQPSLSVTGTANLMIPDCLRGP